jgi:hypothetical protein
MYTNNAPGANLFFECGSGVVMVANVPRLCEGWVLAALSFKLAQSLIEFQMLNLALQPSLRKTAVSSSFILSKILQLNMFLLVH